MLIGKAQGTRQISSGDVAQMDLIRVCNLWRNHDLRKFITTLNTWNFQKSFEKLGKLSLLCL